MAKNADQYANSKKIIEDLMQKCSQLFEEGDKIIKELIIKDKIVMVLGDTGVGKSTILNLLCDIPVIPIEINGVLRLDAQKAIPGINISHSTTASKTLFPAVYSPSDQDFTYVDNARFNDPRGLEYEIANALLRQKVIMEAEFVKILLVTSYDNFTSSTSRGEDLRNSIKDFTSLIQSKDKINTKELQNTTLMIVNYVDALENTAEEIMAK